MTYSQYHNDPVTGVTQQPQQQPRSNSTLIITVAIAVSVIFGIGSLVILLKPWDKGEPDKNVADDSTVQETTAGETEDTGDTAPTEPVTVTFDTPSGFGLDSQAGIVAPLYDQRKEHLLSMTDAETYESLFVVSYLMTEDSTDWDDTKTLETVDGYGEIVGKQNNDPPNVTTIAGKDVVEELIEQTAPSGTIKYTSYYFFDGYYLIQVGCQADAEVEAVSTACTELLDSVKW